MRARFKPFDLSTNKYWPLRVTLFQEYFAANIAEFRGGYQLYSCVGRAESGSSGKGKKGLCQAGGEKQEKEEGDSNEIA